MVALTVPILVTVLGLAYIVSPIDLLPFVFLDDLIVLIMIAFMWMVAFGLVIIETLMPLLKMVGIFLLITATIGFIIKKYPDLKGAFK